VSWGCGAEPRPCECKSDGDGISEKWHIESWEFCEWLLRPDDAMFGWLNVLFFRRGHRTWTLSKPLDFFFVVANMNSPYSSSLPHAMYYGFTVLFLLLLTSSPYCSLDSYILIRSADPFHVLRTPRNSWTRIIGNTPHNINFTFASGATRAPLKMHGSSFTIKIFILYSVG
jgi:hypothetical protein